MCFFLLRSAEAYRHWLFIAEMPVQVSRDTMVTELNESNFDQFVDSNSLAIIDCWAPWCGPCRRMGPIIEELSTELEGKVGVAKLNTDDNQAIAVRFNINAIPTLLIFKDNVLVETSVGLKPKEAILDIINGL